MKKKYVTPSMQEVKLGSVQLLTGSMDKMKVRSKMGGEDIDLLYGGVDEEGELDPD